MLPKRGFSLFGLLVSLIGFSILIFVGAYYADFRGNFKNMQAEVTYGVVREVKSTVHGTYSKRYRLYDYTIEYSILGKTFTKEITNKRIIHLLIFGVYKGTKIKIYHTTSGYIVKLYPNFFLLGVFGLIGIFLLVYPILNIFRSQKESVINIEAKESIYKRYPGKNITNYGPQNDHFFLKQGIINRKIGIWYSLTLFLCAYIFFLYYNFKKIPYLLSGNISISLIYLIFFAAINIGIGIFFIPKMKNILCSLHSNSLIQNTSIKGIENTTLSFSIAEAELIYADIISINSKKYKDYFEFYLICEYEKNNLRYTFSSELVEKNPRDTFLDGKVPVYVNPNNYNQYFVDVELKYKKL